MSLGHMFAYGRSISFSAAGAKAANMIRRRASAWWSAKRNANRCTYSPTLDESLLAAPPAAFSDIARLAQGEVLDGLSARYIAHRFDLLGSGWTEVGYGMRCHGFNGHVYPPGPTADTPDDLARRLSPGNRQRARAIRGLISPAYRPIDWQIDFRSGYRWREDRWSSGILYGHEPGIDIKVPWELARLQHLPLLALAARGDDNEALVRRRECRDQILDFIAANPPGYGVNWVCAMDVGLRAANMVMTHWLLASDAQSANDDDAFERELSASLLAHGRFIMDNLEGSADFRGNHYLADVCGLLFIAAGLRPGDESDAWWAFARREILNQTQSQFGDDGANFEASTCYHRLSAEMAAYATALIIGRDGAQSIPAAHADKLRRMARFSLDVTKPNGRIAQIGDNDNGRLFKLALGHFSSDQNEDHLNHGGLVAVIGALDDGTAKSAETIDHRFLPDAEAASALAAGGRFPDGKPPTPAPSVSRTETAAAPAMQMTETEIALPDASVLDGLRSLAYPDFGLYIWKTDRFFMAIRCGSIGQNGRGGHAHNDQLAIELQIDGEDWLADPGSYAYTAAPEQRDAYRSVMAHAAPRQDRREPASLKLGMFRLADTAQGQCVEFGAASFEGYHVGFGTPVYRAIRIESGCLRVRDAWGGPVDWQAPADTARIDNADALRRHFAIALAFSPGYGSVVDS